MLSPATQSKSERKAIGMQIRSITKQVSDSSRLFDAFQRTQAQNCLSSVMPARY